MKKIVLILTIITLVLLTTGCTNLTTELKKGNMEVAEKMIENKEGLYDIDIDYQLEEDMIANKYWDFYMEGSGITPLLYSIRNQKYDITKKLIEKGADVNFGNGYTRPVNNNYSVVMPTLRTPLLEAILSNDDKKIELIEMLLEKGAKIDIENGLGLTPMTAALSKNKDIIKLLLKYNGNINFKNKGGRSVVFYAEKMEDMKYLIENGADINIKDNNGRNLIMQENKSLEVIKYLVKNGIDIKALDNEGRNVLFYSIDNREKMEYFLSLGLKNIKDKDGWGLYTYVKYKNPKILDLLNKYNIKKDDDINYEIPKIPENKALLIVKRPSSFYGCLVHVLVKFSQGKEIDVNNGYAKYLFIDSGKQDIKTRGKIDIKFEPKAGKIYYLDVSIYGYEILYDDNIISQKEKKLIAEISNKEILEITEKSVEEKTEKVETK